jgi:hypothetical protein
MIQKLLLYPPLAIARVGPSETPCESFHWGPNDLRPRGTGKTTIVPDETLHVSEDGTVTSSLPAQIAFKDAAGFKPVCPFFELHGEWTEGEETVRGPITPEVLAQCGLTPHDLAWRIEVGNLKPFHLTLAPDDRIIATVELAGDVTERRPLKGVSPAGAQQPLVPSGQGLPLGSVQLTKSTEAFPELRLRFTPAAGHTYGPVNLPERSQVFVLPQDRLILNPAAAWCNFVPRDGDPRTNPGGLYATDDDGVSLGLTDDVCDGVIRCALAGVPSAVARIVVGPPDYAPDRRPFTSLADGLTDRVQRADVHDPEYVEDRISTSIEIRDLMERILETMELVNVDAQNERARFENRAIAIGQGLPPDAGEDKAFPRMEPVLGRPFPLTELGRQMHRRFVALEVFEDILRERPELLDQLVRKPMEGDRYYDRRMPAMMRGSDRLPMHLTRRQYDLLAAWVERLRRDAEGGS